MTSEVEGLELEKVARAADAEFIAPWRAGRAIVEVPLGKYGRAAAYLGKPEFASHIATFDPPTVLRILAALRAQAERVRVLEGANERLSRLGRAVERERDDALARAEAAERRAGELEGALRRFLNVASGVPVPSNMRDVYLSAREDAARALLPATQTEGEK